MLSGEISRLETGSPDRRAGAVATATPALPGLSMHWLPVSIVPRLPASGNRARPGSGFLRPSRSL